MPEPNQAALEFLLTRRSRPAKTLMAPWPDRAALMPLITAAARSPDHGKLEPWRFVAFTGTAPARLARLAATRATEAGLDPDTAAKGIAQFEQTGCVVAVIASPKPSDKIPPVEQTLSAGAVCLALLNAALAAGWGANWLTGWPAYDRGFGAAAFGLETEEFVAGFIHVGSESVAPPDRPRPDLAAIIQWEES